MNINTCNIKILLMHLFVATLATVCLSGCYEVIQCGGIAGIPCPDGLMCIDDPRDDCDPRQGGADCFGICITDYTPDSQLMETLDRNREKWASFQIQSYSYSYRRTCECLPDMTREVVITVADDEITAVRYSDTSAEVDEYPPGFYKTISELYIVIEAAIKENAYHISVTYDEHYGYPAEIFIDYDYAVADEEFIVAAGDVTLF